MNALTIAAAIIAGRLSMQDIALILEAVETATERHGSKPGTPGFDVRFYVEHGRLEAASYAEEERRAA